MSGASGPCHSDSQAASAGNACAKSHSDSPDINGVIRNLKIGAADTENLLDKNESLKTELDMLKAQVATQKAYSEAYRCHRKWCDDEASKAFQEIKPKPIDDAINRNLLAKQGGSGTLYKAKLDSRIVAIKVPNDLDLQREQPAFHKEFSTAVQILKRIHHQHIVTLHGACVERCALVYEFLPNGNLETRLNDSLKEKENIHHAEGKGKDCFPWGERIQAAANISTALVYLHDSSPHRIAHGDLKPSNILFDAKNICKLGDFPIPPFRQQNTVNKSIGSCSYVDPDFSDGYEQLLCLADQFAFGIILLQLVTGRNDASTLRKLVSDQMKKLDKVSIPDTNSKIQVLYDLDLMDTTWKSNDKSKEAALMMLDLGLQCSVRKRMNRPDFKNEVWTKLNSISRKEVRCTAAGPRRSSVGS